MGTVLYIMWKICFLICRPQSTPPPPLQSDRWMHAGGEGEPLLSHATARLDYTGGGDPILSCVLCPWVRRGILGFETAPPEMLCRPVRYAVRIPLQMDQGRCTVGKSRRHALEELGGNSPGDVLLLNSIENCMCQTVVLIPMRDGRELIICLLVHFALIVFCWSHIV